MKKTFIPLLLFASLVIAMGITRAQNGLSSGGAGLVLPAEAASRPAGASKILIAYFSVPETDGVDAVSGASRVVSGGKVVGNTQYIAQIIQSAVGGDLFAIETVRKYPGSHTPLLEAGDKERREGARPALSGKLDASGYSVIFLGYPNWYADMPMPLYTFLEKNDLSGKTIVPFVTHGGNDFSRTIQTIAQLQPKATVVTKGLSVSRNSVAGSENEVKAWLRGLDIPK